MDEYDCMKKAISMIRSRICVFCNGKKNSFISEKSNWLRCTECHGGTSTEDIALGVAMGSLVVGAGALLVHEFVKHRYEKINNQILKMIFH